MKTCTCCKVTKPLDAFGAQAKGKYGVTSICKPCTSERGKAWHRANRERSLANKLAYAATHREEARATSVAWRAANVERARAQGAAWSANNKALKSAATARRRAALLRAIPSWASKDDIKMYYALAVNLTRQTGVKAHVDHIVPLQSPIVCGLHCPANLTVITERLNKRKSNRQWPDMPESTALMSVKRSSSLIEYTRAFGDMQGVKWTEPAEATA